jgi:hypothetical protein
MTQELLKLEKKIDRLTKMVEQKSRPHYVHFSAIRQVTGWDKEGFRKAREHGYINYKEDKGQILYDINSIPVQLLK